MGSYYHTANQIKAIDHRIHAALIAACKPDDAGSVFVSSLYSGYDFTVDTDVGELRVSFQPGYNGELPKRGKVGLFGCVCTRFADERRAYAFLGDAVNRYSGKWNFLFSDNFEPEDMREEMLRINPRNFKLIPRNY